ncbi:hypothetical protein DEU56DRAFT_283068 [Suillus clintonianus]|uniref:uncharacterized protein n=1 Tax=Suillus clintonianus TaxID=1904413 RepID=UPI001B88026F|nr:uncharacterized protein DEU56DRAFT_283068 [Suillus clintonianus]KAG2141082.1 hypothetical protein DEU56DRAFT_283068 [Suillus clintonianus]
MNQALLVPEVLLDIFAHLNQIGEPSYGRETLLSRQSLAALAMTCKTFYEPAMDFLWSNMSGLLPLLGCVPRLHPMIYPRAQQSWSRGIEPLSEHERNQFLRHSARVRFFNVSSDADFHLLHAFPFDTCVFPKLQSLSWVVVFTRYLHFFLSPTLRNCYIALVQPDLAQKFIGTRCANLEDLDIVTMGTMAQATHLSETICSCTGLIHLQCPPLDSAAWKHLSTVPTLLTVSIYQESFPGPPSKLDMHNLSSATFLNVTTLRFSYASVADVTAVIQHSEFPSLKEFELIVHVLPVVEALPLLHALSQCKACHTLENIAISDDNTEIEEHPDDIAIYDDDTEIEDHPGDSLVVTRELLGFTQLRTLRIFVHCPIYLDNDILCEALSSWPNLRSLCLYDHHPRPPKVTFRGLFAALRLCPDLHTLRVGVDAMNIDIDPIDPTAESFQHTSLNQLTIYPSPVGDSEVVARIIFFMLPNVHHNTYLSSLWGDVNARLKSLKSSSSLSTGENGD